MFKYLTEIINFVRSPLFADGNLHPIYSKLRENIEEQTLQTVTTQITGGNIDDGQ